MTDSEDRAIERAERAFRAAFDQRGDTYEPVALNPARLPRPLLRGRLLRSGSAAAAVILVVAASTFGLGRWAHHDPQGLPGGPVASKATQIGPPTDVAPRCREPTASAGGRARGRTGAGLDVRSRRRPARARRRRAPAREELGSLGGPDESVTRTGFWLVPAEAKQLAHWYTLNPPPGMTPDGGPHAVGGSRNTDGSWSQEVIYNATSTGPAPHSSALVQVTPVGDHAGVRITVYTSWSPARPAQSFAPGDVTAVRMVIIRNGHRSVTTIDASSDIARLVHTYNALPGTRALAFRCPFMAHTASYRITFISLTREVSAHLLGSCDSAWQVSVDGKPLDPALGDEGRLHASHIRLVN